MPKPTPTKKLSRPRKLTDSLKARICREVALGRSLRKVLKANGMPSMSRVMEVLQEDTSWAEHYARARRHGIELHIDGLIDLSDSANADNAHAVRLRVDTRKWVAAKLAPKVYGDRVELEANVTVSRRPEDRDARILETARTMEYFIAEARRLGGGALSQLPAPSMPRPTATLEAGEAEAARAADVVPDETAKRYQVDAAANAERLAEEEAERQRLRDEKAYESEIAAQIRAQRRPASHAVMSRWPHTAPPIPWKRR